MDGWNTIVSFWDDLFSGAMLVSGNVGQCIWVNIQSSHECWVNDDGIPMKETSPPGSDRTLDTKRPADLQLFTSGGLFVVKVLSLFRYTTDLLSP